MGIKIKILGSNSAAPAHNRHHTSQLLNIEGRYYLVDCGEATQLQLYRYRQRPQKINHIFISHLHGDHYFGLMGLLSSMHLQGRTQPLKLFGPKGLAEIITIQLKYSDTVFNYPVEFIEVDTSTHQKVHEDKWVSVYSIPLNHRIPCSGFLFEEKPRKRRIIKEKLPADFSLININRLKDGEDILDTEGNVLYKNDEMTLPPRKSYRYAFCSDTKYDESIIPYIQGVDLLYHESTFMEDQLERAANTYHSTARQAATIAKKAKVDRLLLGHFSTRYKEIAPILEEALTVFDKSELAIEGNDVVLGNL